MEAIVGVQGLEGRALTTLLRLNVANLPVLVKSTPDEEIADNFIVLIFREEYTASRKSWCVLWRCIAYTS